MNLADGHLGRYPRNDGGFQVANLCPERVTLLVSGGVGDHDHDHLHSRKMITCSLTMRRAGSSTLYTHSGTESAPY
jgi:hypothetical protein